MNVLTFDIEEWFHIDMDPKFNQENKWKNYEKRLDQNMEVVFELLSKYNQKATFFCLGWIAREYPHIIKKIDHYGHEIGSHSDLHRIAYTLDKVEFEQDLVRSIDSLSQLTGKEIISYRAPAFSIKDKNKWALDILLKNGIKIDSSIFPTTRDFGGFSSFSSDNPCMIELDKGELKEFPINLQTLMMKRFVFSGGGYFRFFPQWAIEKMMDRSDYVMTYFHPREFDSGTPMIKHLSLSRKFKSYYNIKSTFSKLDYFLSSKKFVDLRTAVSEVDWNKVERVKIVNK